MHIKAIQSRSLLGVIRKIKAPIDKTSLNKRNDLA